MFRKNSISEKFAVTAIVCATVLIADTAFAATPEECASLKDAAFEHLLKTDVTNKQLVDLNGLIDDAFAKCGTQSYDEAISIFNALKLEISKANQS